ncbi:hypothetical protein OHS70_06785 [Streptomyces sp. NBC_00390]|uniref:hypothetical protein n=1 Tax=Streptomyces sp. NBC_00390 TaxID=2975736 RepID=UPI002E1F725A
MIESVPVRCPACRRDHLYAPPVYPCACGAPLVPPLVRPATPEPITHRTWTDDWVAVRCPECDRRDEWPQPELGCPCGTVLRIAVHPDRASAPEPASMTEIASGTMPASGPEPAEASGQRDPADGPVHTPLPRTAVAARRPTFRPVTIRTTRDAVTAAALYLKWLGFRDVVQPDVRPLSGIDLHGPGLVAQVDPSTRPATLRDIECLWLNGLSASAESVFFSLAGYADDARARADILCVPLFVLDLTGCPQPVNGPADDLISAGG